MLKFQSRKPERYWDNLIKQEKQRIKDNINNQKQQQSLDANNSSGNLNPTESDQIIFDINTYKNKATAQIEKNIKRKRYGLKFKTPSFIA